MFVLVLVLVLVVLVLVLVVVVVVVVAAVVGTQLIFAFSWTPKDRQIGDVFACFCKPRSKKTQ